MSQDYFTLIPFQNSSQKDSKKPIRVDLDTVRLENQLLRSPGDYFVNNRTKTWKTLVIWGPDDTRHLF